MKETLIFDHINILIVGDIMLDVYKHGVATHISPEAPVPVVKIYRKSTNAGGAANVATNLHGLGCQVELVGYIGDDNVGHELKAQLTRQGIGHMNLIPSTATTISKTRILADNQHVIRYDNDSTIDTPLHRDRHESKLIEKLTKLGEEHSFNAVVVSDYAKGTITDIVMQTIQSSFVCPIVCDIKPTNSKLFHDVLCITPNLTEAKQLVDTKYHATLQELAKAIKKKFNLETVVITLSHNGICLLDKNDKFYTYVAHIAIDKKEPQRKLDITGAGDTVLSTLTACIAAKYNFRTAVELSNLAAGIVVGKIGTAVCDIKELRNAYLQL